MAVRSTYMRCKVQLADGEHDLRIGLNDQEAAKGKFKVALEKIPDDDAGLSQDWLRFAAWTAAKREIGYKGTLDAWKAEYIGLDIDEGGEESPGTAPA